MAPKNLPLNSHIIFTGENNQIWLVKMQAFLKAYDLWETVTEDKPFTNKSHHDSNQIQ